MPLEIKGKFVRQRIRAPSAFRAGSFRTQVVGSHRRVAGKLKSTGKWATQTLLHPLRELGGKCTKHHCTEKQLKAAFRARRHVR